MEDSTASDSEGDPTLDPSEQANESDPTFESGSQGGEGGQGEGAESEPTFEESIASSSSDSEQSDETGSEGSGSNSDSTNPGTGEEADTGAASTGDPSLEDLDSVFNEQIGTFDGMILREQRNAEREANSTLSTGTGNQTIATAAQAAGVGTFADYSVGSEEGKSGEVVNGKVIDESEMPADIAASHDDDVVASQIKEAAMSEPDPVQREILWQEYRKYKGL